MGDVDVSDRGLGMTRLCAERCATCILRPGGIALAPGRLQRFIAEARSAESYVVCHETLPDVAPAGVRPAVCRGFYDRYSTNALRIMERLWGFVEIPPPNHLPAARGGTPLEERPVDTTTNDADGPVHLMILDAVKPRFPLQGTAAYACDRDGELGVSARMSQRTAHRDKVTCPDCLASTGKEG